MCHKLCVFVTGCEYHLFLSTVTQGGAGASASIFPLLSCVKTKDKFRASMESSQSGSSHYDSCSPQRHYSYYFRHPGARIGSIVLGKINFADDVTGWVLVRIVTLKSFAGWNRNKSTYWAACKLRAGMDMTIIKLLNPGISLASKYIYRAWCQKPAISSMQRGSSQGIGSGHSWWRIVLGFASK